jgi:hypothetical protein
LVATARTDPAFNPTLEAITIISVGIASSVVTIVEPGSIVQPLVLRVKSVLAPIDSLVATVQSVVTPFDPSIGSGIDIGAAAILCTGVRPTAKIDVSLHAGLDIRLGASAGLIDLSLCGSSDVYIGLRAGLSATCACATLSTGLRPAARLLGNRPTRHGERQGAHG